MRKNSNIWVLFQLKIFVLAEHRVSSHSDPLWLQRVLRYCTSQTVLKKQTSKPSEAAWGTISRTETYFKDRVVPPEELLTPSYSISSICIRAMLSKKKICHTVHSKDGLTYFPELCHGRNTAHLPFPLQCLSRTKTGEEQIPCSNLIYILDRHCTI